jgi:intein/homing endonuclease
MTQPSPSATDKHLALVDEIRRIRESKTVAFKRPATRLKTTIAGLNGQPQPLTLRYYQVVGTFNLLKLRRMLLGDGTGLGKCEVGSTLLLTSQGLRPIETLAPASLDRASSPDEGFYDMDHQVDVWTGRRMAKVSRFYWSGKKPTLKVTTRNGYQFEGTLVHPMRVRDEGGEAWKELRWVREGDFLCVGRSEAPFPQEDPRITFDAAALSTNAKTYTYPTILTPELATLLGYIVAEGHSRKYGVTVTQFRDLNPEPHEEIRDLFQSAFGWEGNYHDLERDTAIKVPSIGIREFLRTLGIGDELSRTKSVPDVVLRGTRESVRGFLSALIESEGSVADGGGVEFSSSSETLARQTQLLLLRFGVISTLSEKHIKGNDHTYWRLTFFGDDARLYQERVGFRSSRKGDDLRASLAKTSNPNKDLVPHAQEPVRALKARILDVSSRSGANDRRKGSGIKQFGETFQSTLKHILLGHRNPSYSWLVKLLGVSHELGLSTSPEYEAVLALVRDRHFYDPVVKIEPGEAEVMDIEVDDPEHCYIANGLLSHNTVQVIAFLCYLWESEHDSKAIVVSPKSALRQWKSEIERFSTGIKSFVVSGSAEERKAIYEAFLEHPTGPDAEKAVLILNYHILVRDWTAGSVKPRLPDGQPDPKQPASPGLLDGMLAKLKNPIVIYDECTAFKNPSTKTWQVCRFLADRANRVYGLTATLLKNKLMEGFSIYKVIVPEVFKSKTAFMNDYCVTKLQSIAGSNRKIPIVVGYKNLAAFRAKIDLYFLGRPKHVVSDELPKLITKEVTCVMSKAEDAKYKQALSGVLEMGDGEVKDYEEHKAFVALTYCQQVVDSLSLLKFKDGDVIEDFLFDESVKVDGLGSKEQALVDLITEEFDEEKVIVYTRFASLVPRLREILKNEGIKSVEISGNVKDTATNPRRQQAQEAFQDQESDVRVIIITDAGSEAINLQAASAIIFYDSPWSWGNYVQLLGRPIRIGSPHQHVVAVHIVAERPRDAKKDRKTIDHYTIELLQRKKDLVDKVLGESAVGALDFGTGKSFQAELIENLRTGK